MSSSSSKVPSAPPINPQLQLESALTIPPDHPGNSFQGSAVSSNNHPFANPPHQTLITFSHVLQYYWRGINEYQSNHNIAFSTPPQIWLAQNVYPLVTPMRMICFSMSQISFMLACGIFMETEFYKTHIVGGGGDHHHVHAPPLVFSVFANVVHFVFLVFLLFFSFFTAAYERYLHHDLLKSLGELAVMEVMSLLISGIGHKQHQEEGAHDEVVVLLAMCAFLTIDSLCIIILLKPGHHYSMLDATLTLTLHLGLEGKGGIYAIPATLFVFVILAIKNFLWRRIGHA